MKNSVTTHPTEEAEPGDLNGRQGWEEQFQHMAEQGNDKLLDGGDLVPTEWEKTE